MGSSVVIQQERGQFLNANGFTAWLGFEERGYEIRFADWEQMAAGVVPVEPATIAVGSVAFVRRALRRLGAEPPALGYPPELAKYLGRRVWRTTWAEVRADVDSGPPVFVKPLDHDKAFTGYVVGAFRDLIRTARWPDDMPLWAADPVEFRSEWRVFFRRGEAIGIGHYKGDPLLFPDPATIQAALDDYRDAAPIACALDFGVTADGATRLVEVNEGFALGCYGLGPLAYSAFLEDRWRELTDRIPVEHGAP